MNNYNKYGNTAPSPAPGGQSAAPQAKKQPAFKKGLIIALYIGIAMVFVPAAVSMFTSHRFATVDVVLLAAQVVTAAAAVFFLNRNAKISIVLLAAFIGVTLYHPIMRGFRGFGIWSIWDQRFDIKYTAYCIARAAEMVLAAMILIGLNRACKPLAIAAAVLLVVLDTWWIATTYMRLPSTGDSDNLDGILMWTAYYSELIIPVVLLICAINPHAIHNSILIIDGYFAIRLVLFIAADLLSDSYYRVHDFFYLLNTCWMPVMLIFGMNAVLVFPIRFKKLAIVFGLSLAVIAVVVLLMAGQQAENDWKKKNEQSRQQHMNEMRDNILSWKRAGFSDSFTTDAALQMYKEGRITASEYQWLIQQLIGRR